MGEIYGVPRLPGRIVHRQRISSILDTDAPFVVVRGLAGAGKTVAVADWAGQRAADATPGVWFTADDGSADRAAFWYDLLQLVFDAGLLPDGGVLHGALQGREGSFDLRRLLLRGFAELTHDIVIVIDDIHLVDEQAARDLVAVLKASPRVRIVALGRGQGPFEGDDVELALAPVRLSSRHLLFTTDEMAEMLANMGVVDDGGSLADAIREVTGGLPLITLAVTVMLQLTPLDPTLDRETLRARVAGLGQRAMGGDWALRIGDDRRLAAAMRLSIAEVLTQDLAERLSGIEGIADILDGLEGRGFGRWEESPLGPVFRFEEGIREGLRGEALRRFPDEIDGLRNIIMRWELERGNSLESLRHAVDTSELEFAGEIVARRYVDLLTHHRSELIALFGTVSRRTLGRNPLLAMLLALALNAEGNKARALEMFAITYVSAHMAGPGSNPVRRTILFTVESAALRFSGEPEKAHGAADRAAALVNELTLDQRDELSPFLGALNAHIGLSYFYSGRRGRAREHFELACGRPFGSPEIDYLHGLALTAGAWALDGDMPEARAFIAQAELADLPSDFDAGYFGAFYQLAAGQVALESGEYEEALRRVTIMAPHLETIEHWPVFMHLQAMAHLGLGRAIEGATALEMALARGARPSVTTVNRSHLDATLATLLIAAGHLRRAHAVLKRHPRTDTDIATAWARLHLVLGQADAALADLESLEPASPREIATTLLLRAAASLRLGQEEIALDEFERAVILLRDRQLRSPFTLLSGSDREALLGLAARGERLGRYGEYIAELSSLPPLLPDAHTTIDLSEREVIVLRRLRNESSSAVMAAELFVSVNTIKSQLRSIYRKLDVTSRAEALAKASRLGLFER